MRRAGQAIVATGSDRRELVLARLPSSELIRSIADVAAHLLHTVQLHLVQLQTPRLESTLIVLVNDPPLPASIITDDNRSQSWMVNRVESHSSTARPKGLTYPSALLDCTEISGCTIPDIEY